MGVVGGGHLEVMVQTCNSSVGEAETGGSLQVSGQFGFILRLRKTDTW